MRGLVVGALRQALAGAGHRGATHDRRRRCSAPSAPPPRPLPPAVERALWAPARPPEPGFAEPLPAGWAGGAGRAAAAAEDPRPDLPLGVARAQVHETYVIAQTADGIVIVDQHAAHERLVYERLKAARAAAGVAGQMLLIPEVVELDAAACARLLEAAAELARLGLVLEPFGGHALCLRETPALLGEVDGARLLADVADALAEDEGRGLEARIDAVLSQHGLPRLGARRAADARRGDERAPARDGGDAALRPVQPRPADLCRAEARRHRAAVRAAMIDRSASMQIALDDPRLWAGGGRRSSSSSSCCAPSPARRGRWSRWRGTSPTSTARSGR